MDVDEEFSLDDARDGLFTLQRSCERHAAALVKVVELLNSKKPEDEWLLEVQDEAAKAIAFHQQQLSCCQDFHNRISAYIDLVRNEANRLAMEELSSGILQTRDSEQCSTSAEDIGTPEAPAATYSHVPTAGAAAAVAADGAGSAAAGGGSRRKSSKMVHPELHKFKLEKQAKILGKYGGIPALGAGLVLPRLQRDSILKATGSPAAREIHYSKVENKDAPKLAEVMRFKVRRSEEGAGGSGTPAPSPWQAEISAKKGKVALDGTDAKDQVAPSTRTHGLYAEELGDVLQRRQAALEEALQVERTPQPASATGPHISADALDELAEKLRRRQSAAKKVEADAAAVEAEVREAAATPATPAWSNATEPFGGELTATLQRRAELKRAAAAQAAAAAGPTPPATNVAEGGGPDPVTTARRQLQPAVTPDAQPGTSGNGVQPVTPVFGLTLQARRSVPQIPLTPPGAVTATELQEKLQRRLSALDSKAATPALAPAAPEPECESH